MLTTDNYMNTREILGHRPSTTQMHCHYLFSTFCALADIDYHRQRAATLDESVSQETTCPLANQRMTVAHEPVAIESVARPGSRQWPRDFK